MAYVHILDDKDGLAAMINGVRIPLTDYSATPGSVTLVLKTGSVKIERTDTRPSYRVDEL